MVKSENLPSMKLAIFRVFSPRLIRTAGWSAEISKKEKKKRRKRKERKRKDKWKRRRNKNKLTNTEVRIVLCNEEREVNYSLYLCWHMQQETKTLKETVLEIKASRKLPYFCSIWKDFSEFWQATSLQSSDGLQFAAGCKMRWTLAMLLSPFKLCFWRSLAVVQLPITKRSQLDGYLGWLTRFKERFSIK